MIGVVNDVRGIGLPVQPLGLRGPFSLTHRGPDHDAEFTTQLLVQISNLLEPYFRGSGPYTPDLMPTALLNTKSFLIGHTRSRREKKKCMTIGQI